MELLHRLGAIEEIKCLKAKYLRLVDTQDWDGLRALFTGDALLDVGNGPQGFDETLAFWKTVLVGTITVHSCHAPEIEIIDANRARALWPMDDRIYRQAQASEPFGHLVLRGFGRYDETYVREGETWKIQSTRLDRTLLAINEPDSGSG